MALIECKDVVFTYDGVIVSDGINFSVNRGDYLCILGENGSGKSTLIKGLLGLKSPQSGKILLGEGLKRDQIGYLPQQTPAQKDFPASVYEVVLSGRLAGRGWKPFYSFQDKALALDNMEKLGISGLRKRCYRELSGGQQQRVLLARALCAATQLLVLDEPAAGLDPMVTKELYQLIRDINQMMGMSIVMVSHDMHGAISNASHILHLKKQQEFFGPVETYKRSEIGSFFLGGKFAEDSPQDSANTAGVDFMIGKTTAHKGGTAAHKGGTDAEKGGQYA